MGYNHCPIEPPDWSNGDDLDEDDEKPLYLVIELAKSSPLIAFGLRWVVVTMATEELVAVFCEEKDAIAFHQLKE